MTVPDVFLARDVSQRVIGIFSTLDNAKDGVLEWARPALRNGESLVWRYDNVRGCWITHDVTIVQYRPDLGVVLPKDESL